MNRKEDVDGFLAQKRLAIAGISRSGKKFGNVIFTNLKEKGYTVYPVHPEARLLHGSVVYQRLDQIPEEVEGLIVVIPPDRTVEIVKEAAESGIKRIWMQQGSESKEAVRFCEEQGISVVAGECILMFAEPVAFYHRFHRWIWKILGKLPT